MASLSGSSKDPDMEWTHVCQAFAFEHDGDPELAASMSDCTWRKCGEITAHEAKRCSELAAEAGLATTDHAMRKYRLKEISKCGRYKLFTHKRGKASHVVIRQVHDYVVDVDLHSGTGDTYMVSFMNDVGDVAGATLQMNHNIGYATVLVKQAFKVAKHVPVVFSGFAESGRCNMWKALNAHRHKPVVKRPAADQTVRNEQLRARLTQ